MGEKLGMKAKNGNLQQLSIATRMRMLLNERVLYQTNLHEDIMATWRKSDRDCFAWQDWYHKGIVATIYAARGEGEELGVTEQLVKRKLEEF